MISWWIIFCACIDYIRDVKPNLKLIQVKIQVTDKKQSTKVDSQFLKKNQINHYFNHLFFKKKKKQSMSFN